MEAVSLQTTTGQRLDDWAEIYGVYPRLPAEPDAEFRKRIMDWVAPKSVMTVSEREASRRKVADYILGRS